MDNDKNLDLVCAIRLAADVQPIKADVSMINDVRTSSEILARMSPLLVHLPLKYSPTVTNTGFLK